MFKSTLYNISFHGIQMYDHHQRIRVCGQHAGQLSRRCWNANVHGCIWSRNKRLPTTRHVLAAIKDLLQRRHLNARERVELRVRAWVHDANVCVKYVMCWICVYEVSIQWHLMCWLGEALKWLYTPCVRPRSQDEFCCWFVRLPVSLWWVNIPYLASVHAIRVSKYAIITWLDCNITMHG